ncbi:MAG TPA: hypothetical protein VJ843_02035 [Candidatus Saccharimonadales bacterium]|nr:hypothetical protein [Candidatus Saccharimonadales bacterium]
MEDLQALTAETTQAFLDRIYPYNSEELPGFETKMLVDALDATVCRAVGNTSLSTIPVYTRSKIPTGENISEETQEMEIPILPETTAVLVKTVRMNVDPRLVPFGESPHKYPTGERQRFFLAKVLD